MNNFLLYLLKVSSATMLFYICYILFLSRDTFYVRNRIALLSILLLSLVIPAIRIFNSITTAYQEEHSNPVTAIIYSGSVIGTNMANKITLFDSRNIVIWLYLLVSLFFLLRLIISLTQTFLIIGKGVLRDDGFPKVVLTDKVQTPFSFFPYIVLSQKTLESDDYNEIVAHENTHVRQYHTFDLLLSELMIVFLWFDPFLWLIKRSIILNHEFLADNFSIKYTSSPKEYQYKLLNIRKDLINVPLAHNFSSLIKKRIIMINKKPTSNYAALKSILILPAAAILFVLFSFRQGAEQVNQKYLFSKSSDSEILTFLAINTGYPQEARDISDTAKIFVVIKVAKGGIIKECKAFTDKKDIKVPLLPEIVIVGHKSTDTQGTAGKEHNALKTECLRVSKTLNEAKIPEWKEKDAEFAVEFKFSLK